MIRQTTKNACTFSEKKIEQKKKSSDSKMASFRNSDIWFNKQGYIYI